MNVQNFYDPNAHIDPDTRYEACQYSLFPFNRARVEAHEVNTGEPNSFILARAGDRQHLVYVRVTFEDEAEEGTGPMPGILIDLAKEIGAVPHVVRVHFRAVGCGTGIQYFGHEELEQELKSGVWWRRQLLKGRTAREYLRLVGNRISKLEVEIHREPPGPWPQSDEPEVLTEEELKLREIFKDVEAEYEQKQPEPYPGSVWVGLRIDTLPAHIARYPICMSGLTSSANRSDEHRIFTCTCGVPQCAGIWRGVEIAHEDGLVVWRIRGISPRRVVVFDRAQYRPEILGKIRQALAIHKEYGPKAYLGAGTHREIVSKALYYAEEDSMSQ